VAPKSNGLPSVGKDAKSQKMKRILYITGAALSLIVAGHFFGESQNPHRKDVWLAGKIGSEGRHLPDEYWDGIDKNQFQSHCYIAGSTFLFTGCFLSVLAFRSRQRPKISN
jgi:hypothetical protein